MSKVYIKKFHGKHFHIDYRESNTVSIVFPKLNNKDRFIFDIEFDKVPTEQEIRPFIEKVYRDLEIIYLELSAASKKTSITEVLERINYG